MSRHIAALAFLVAFTATATASEKPVPLKSGNYKFRYCDVEYVNPICFPGLDVKIAGREIRVTNNTNHLTGGKGLIESGTLHWHQASGGWIIVSSPEDKTATEVGGCSDGPRTIDLIKKIYYTC